MIYKTVTSFCSTVDKERERLDHLRLKNVDNLPNNKNFYTPITKHASTTAHVMLGMSCTHYAVTMSHFIDKADNASTVLAQKVLQSKSEVSLFNWRSANTMQAYYELSCRANSSRFNASYQLFEMNKKNYRLVGTLSSKESMQNLITDLKNAKSLLPSQTTSENSQSLIHSISYIKKKPLIEINKTINYANTHVTSNTSITSTKISKNQSPEIYVTSTPHKKRTTNKNTFQLQESYNLENQISVPKNTFQIKPSRINNSQICDSLNKSIAEQTHIVHVVQDLFKKLNKRLDIIEKKESENHAMLLRLTKIKNRRVQSIPKCLLFKSIQNLILFDNANDDIYNEVVDYFIYLGGFNPIDCATIYFNCAFEKVEKTTLEVTWHGTKDLKALKTTCFAHACEDAISFRRQQKRPSLENDESEEPFLRRVRIPNKRQTGNTRIC